jgi:hypothetical protein
MLTQFGDATSNDFRVMGAVPIRDRGGGDSDDSMRGMLRRHFPLKSARSPLKWQTA